MHECYTCGYLNKSRCKDSPNGVPQKQYGCDYRFQDGHPGYVVGWIRNDSELRTMGCSLWTDKKKQLFEEISLF